MLLSEFYERTNIMPREGEYHFIELSYYDFDGDKDEFCKAWKRDKKSGKWELEYRLRREIEEQNEAHKKQIEEMQERIDSLVELADFYHEQYKLLKNTKTHLQQIMNDLKSV
jgi:uncharacterized membrane protein YgaE (UPF0421/DUF939 family)